jgi:hypothetical protein
MAYFAHIKDDIVVCLHTVADAVIVDAEGVMQETLGQEFLANLHGYAPDDLVQCFDDGSFRFNYPGRGFTYDSTRDAFIPPTPYPSWVLDEDTCLWVAPIAYPAEGVHVWDEETGDWVTADETV